MPSELLAKVETNVELSAENQRLLQRLNELESKIGATPTELPTSKMSREEFELSMKEMELRLAEMQTQWKEREQHSARNQELPEIKKRVSAVLESTGLSELGISHAIKSLGGIRIFQIDPENGEVCIEFNGELRPVRDVLPVHPLVQAILTDGGPHALQNTKQILRRQIEAKKQELAQADQQCRANPYSNGLLIRRGQLRKELSALEAQDVEPTAPTRKRPVDSGLLIRRGELRRLVAEKKAAVEKNRSDNHALLAFNAANKQLKEIELQIQRQQNGG